MSFNGVIRLNRRDIVSAAVVTVIAFATLFASGHVDASEEQGSGFVVAALGFLEPASRVIRLAGSGEVPDARLAELYVEETDEVEFGTVLGRLDTYDRLSAALELAETEVLKRRALLDQSKAIAAHAQALAKVELATAQSRMAFAASELERTSRLLESDACSEADYDRCTLEFDIAVQSVAKAEAEVIRQAAIAISGRDALVPLDVYVAEMLLEQAVASRRLAETELETSLIRAPKSGLVLKIHHQVGERLGDEGLLDMADIEEMQIVAEVYQSDIRNIRLAQRVSADGAPFDTPLTGQVTQIRPRIERQTEIGADPASATDARVAIVRVALDPPSQERARNFAGLQVSVRFEAD